MEDILFANDSDDESDGGNNNAATAPAPAAVIAPPPPPPPEPVPPPAPTDTAPPPHNASQADVSKRPRDLYSPASAAAASNKGGGAPQQLHPKSTVAVPSQPPPQTSPPPQPAMPAPQQQQPTQGYLPQTTSTPSYHHPPPPQQPTRLSSGGSSSRGGSGIPQPGPIARGMSADPYAPMAVANMKERHTAHQQQQRARSDSMGSSSQHHRSSSSSAVVIPSSTASASSSQQHHQMTPEEMRKRQQEKDHFVNFTKVLLRYLEQKDRNVYLQVKGVIKECAERNKRREPGYESVTHSMKVKLKQVVSEQHWKRAQAYFVHFLKQKRATDGAGASSSSSRGPSVPGSGPDGQPDPSVNTSTISSSAPAPQPSVADPTQATAAANKAEMDRLKKEKQLQQRRQAAAAKKAAAAIQQQPLSVTSAPTADPLVVVTDSAGGGGAPTPAAPSAPTSGASTTKKGGPKATRKQTPKTGSATQQQGLQRKGSTVSAAGSAKEPFKPTPTPSTVVIASPAAPVETIPAEVVKEYNEFMELVDHAMNLNDWESSSLLLGQKMHTTLSEEQQQLLKYDDKKTDVAEDEQDGETSFPRRGWNERNVLSVRTAWAKVRLKERTFVKNLQEKQRKEGKEPSNFGPFLPLPAPYAEKTLPATSWYNEDVAEGDATLAALSEATQSYLKEILEKAVHCARQRENVDGIRLWHQQITRQSSAGRATGDKSPLSLRLGCNVRRQLAQAHGNAAMTVKRMEEALERQTDLPTSGRVLSETTLVQLGSIEEAAVRPRLCRAVDSADLDAKRSYEVFGGKDEISEPPLGRLSKKPKLQVSDLQHGIQLPPVSRFHRTRPPGFF